MEAVSLASTAKKIELLSGEITDKKKKTQMNEDTFAKGDEASVCSLESNLRPFFAGKYVLG
jgi:hypothetical protein